MSLIPKTIHYCWFGGNPMPELAQNCLKSWDYYLPDYKKVLWDEIHSTFTPTHIPEKRICAKNTRL